MGWDGVGLSLRVQNRFFKHAEYHLIIDLFPYRPRANLLLLTGDPHRDNVMCVDLVHWRAFQTVDDPFLPLPPHTEGAKVGDDRACVVPSGERRQLVNGATGEKLRGEKTRLQPPQTSLPMQAAGRAARRGTGERESARVDKEMVAEQGMGSRWEDTAEGRESTQQ